MPIARPRILRRLVAPVPLRWALTVPFVLLIVGATMLVGYLSYRSGQVAVENLGHQLVTETNTRVTEKLKTYVQAPFLINRLNVDAVNQGQLDVQDIPALESTLFNRSQQFDQVSAILFVSAKGTFRLVERFPDLYLGIADPPRPDQMRIYRLDSEGKPGQLVYTGNDLDVRRDRPWYRQAVAAGQPIWSSISQYGDAKELTLNAAQPVYDRTSKGLLGVFAVHLRLDTLSQFLQQLDISRFGQVMITDASGNLIAASTNQGKPDQVGAASTVGAFERLRIDDSPNDLTRSLGQYLRSHSTAFTAVDQPQYLEFNYGGDPQYVQVTPFQDQYGLDWRVITVIPQSYFLQAIQNNAHTTVLLCLLTLGTAIGLGLLAAERLTVRFAQIRQVSHKLAVGNLDQRLPTNGWIEELNDLSQTYNQMADQLQQSFDRIKTALTESKEKFTTTFRISPEPVAIVSLEGRFLEVNESMMRFFGYSKAELIGSTALERKVWHNLEQRDQYRALLNQQGSVRNLEVQVCTQSGEIKTVLLSAEGCTLEGQDRIIVTHRDISDRKAAELALQQSEARYRAIVEDQSELICRSLPDSTLTFVNDAYCRYFGVRREDIIGKSYRPLIDERDSDEVLQQMRAMSRANPTLLMENRVVVNGQVRWMQWIDRLLFDAQGSVTEVQAVGRDITALKQTEAALRASEVSLRQAQQIAHLGSWELDPATQKLTWSEELFRIVGLDATQTEPSRAELMAMIPAEDRAVLEAAIERAIADGTPYELEHRLRRADGTVRYLVSKGQAMLNDQQVIKLYGTALDITDRKHLEQSLRTQAEEEHLLTTITQNIRQSLDLEQILSTTVVEVQQTLKADRALIFQLKPDYSGQIIQEAVVPAYPVSDQMRWEDEHFPEECQTYYQQAVPRIVPDIRTDEWGSCLTDFLQEMGVKSKIVAPIVKTRGRSTPSVWGLLIVHACADRREWQQSEAHLLQKICNQLAIAIDQANLYQELQVELAERRQAEAALRESEARLAMAQKVAQVGNWEWNLGNQQRSWSEVTFRHWGRDLALGEPSYAELLDMVHPDDRAILQQQVQTAVTQGTAYSLDVRVLHPDGSTHYLDCRVEPILDDAGQVVKLVGTSLDITDRKRTEKALEEREAMLRAIGDNLPKGFIYQRVYEPGKGSYYSYISAGIERLLGLKPEAVLADPSLMQSVGFAEDLAIAARAVQESMQNLTPVELQMRNRTAQGEVQWSSIRSVPRRAEEGRIVWDGVEVDITDLKRTEAALRASEEQFRRAFDDAPIGVSLISPTGQYVKVNRCYCNLLGYTEAELLALTFQEITHPADLEADLLGYQQMLVGEISSFQLEKRYITKQGVAVPVLLNAAPIRDQDGQLLYMVAHIQDIRDRLKVERMKDEFISVVSHELRTPLTSIRGALGILGSGVFSQRPEKAQQMLSIAISNSERLVHLVDDILTLERLESGKVQLVKEQCQVAELMQQAIDCVQAIADQGAIALAVAPLVETLWAVPDAIVQTLTNLLGNAIKFSYSGSTVSLKAELLSEEAAPAACIRFAVSDRGRGIPADKLEIIFEQFQQVDVSDSRQKGGTGLGLAICKKIVQQHGGRIWAESILGEGSTFYFTLPLKDECN